jgi:hypothetical protein
MIYTHLISFSILEGLQYAQRRFQYSPEKFLRPLRGADSNSASQPSYVYPKPAATGDINILLSSFNKFMN